jgi:hypothetical protein
LLGAIAIALYNLPAHAGTSIKAVNLGAFKSF